ncbi:MAG: FG-GAP-like repeat-containing protein, partial [Rhodospirillaceae bacterium]
MYIESTFPGGTFTGSGVMVGPNDVLTASHVLYLPAYGGAATSVRVIPAYQPSPYAAPYGEATSTSFHYFPNYDPNGDFYLVSGDGRATLSDSEVDIGIIDLSVPLGNQMGWMQFDTRFHNGYVDITGYPTANGWNMTTSSGYASMPTIDSTLIFSGVALGPGYSGGPVWYETDGIGYVVGVVSTASWGPSVSGTYAQLSEWIEANDALIANQPAAAPTSYTTSESALSAPLQEHIAIGTAASDHLDGTSGDDRLSGSAGNDMFLSTAGADTVAGDQGVDTMIYELPRANYSVSYAHGSVRVYDYADGSTDTLRDVERLRFADSLMLTEAASHQYDRDGDGRADIVTRSLQSGIIQVITVHDTTADAPKTTNVTAGVDWTIVGNGDFNGDGRGDILWQHDSGIIATWNLDGADFSGGGVVEGAPANARVAGTGDFDGDRRSDILWRASDGSVSVSLLNDHTIVGGGSAGAMSSDWRIAGTGDFDGDNRTDVLWHNDNGAVAMWLMNGTSHSGGGAIATPSIDWRIAGIGDFNGDGAADIVWRQDGGMTSIWLMDGENIVGGLGAVVSNRGLDWTLAGSGDFNADGKADILWQRLDGALEVERMDGLHIQAVASIDTLEAISKTVVLGCNHWYGLGMARREELNDEQWAIIEPLLPEPPKREDGKGRPR